VLAALGGGRFTLVTSWALLQELSEVLGRPRMRRKYGVTQADIREFVALLRAQAYLANVSGVVRLCRDPDDDMVIETALRGRANILVTRDADFTADSELSELLAVLGIEIMTVQRFLDRLAGDTD
jgi:putative PIN family toxin of toxin-antitoxin system